ncbi:MAG: cytidylate kinase-like family protein [Isosphaeraceae bacterium]
MYSREQAAAVASAWIRSSEQAAPKAEGQGTRPFTIALSREAGSGGLLVAREVGRRLNWPVYDHELLEHLAAELRVDVLKLQNVDERPGSRLVECLEAFANAPTVTELTYFRRLLKLVLALGARGDCVIVGRGAGLVLPPATTLRVRVISEREDRIASTARENAISPAEAAKKIDGLDQGRRRFIQAHFHRDPADPLLYDLALNASRLTIGECAQAVIDLLQQLRARTA